MNLDKIKIWFSSLTKKTASFEKKRIRPTHDWVVILIVTQTIMLGILAFAFYFYLKINKGEFFQVVVDESQNEVKINSVLLKSTIENINTRAQNFNKINQGQGIPPDPSA